MSVYLGHDRYSECLVVFDAIWQETEGDREWHIGTVRQGVLHEGCADV